MVEELRALRAEFPYRCDGWRARLIDPSLDDAGGDERRSYLTPWTSGKPSEDDIQQWTVCMRLLDGWIGCSLSLEGSWTANGRAARHTVIWLVSSV